MEGLQTTGVGGWLSERMWKQKVPHTCARQAHRLLSAMSMPRPSCSFLCFSPPLEAVSDGPQESETANTSVALPVLCHPCCCHLSRRTPRLCQWWVLLWPQCFSIQPFLLLIFGWFIDGPVQRDRLALHLASCNV